MIRITQKLVIDSKKVKKYLKRGFKFAFSQIGLAGLVVGYVILGALLFMKIESEYEKENQNKIEKNRDDFFENVKVSAETIFNEYLDVHFHSKYNEYRNQEILKRNEEFVQSQIHAQNSRYNSNNASSANSINNFYDLLQQNQQSGFNNDNKDANSNANFFFNYNSQRIHKNRDTERTIESADVLEDSEINDSSGGIDSGGGGGGGTNQANSENAVKEVVKFDEKSKRLKEKPAWHIELHKETFYKEINQHLRNLLIENDKIEDKEKQAMLVREDVWSYPNALLYSATVITTIGKK